GNVTGDVGDGAIVNDGGDLTGVNTGSVGGNMVTADEGSAAAGDDQAIENQGPVSQGEGDAIQAHGNVNTGEGDQTNIDFDQNNGGAGLREVHDDDRVAVLAREGNGIERIEREPGRGEGGGGDAGGDVNFNIGDGTQTVVDNETEIDLSTHVEDSIVDSENVAVAGGDDHGARFIGEGGGGGDAIANDEGNVANEAIQFNENEITVDNSHDNSVDESFDIDAQLGLAGGDVTQDIADPEPAPLPEAPMDDVTE
ncbi:MAG: hypothetical protein AAFZ07_26525, partial [Actinomycetota bacterium]